jgi:hypothetical protein
LDSNAWKVGIPKAVNETARILSAIGFTEPSTFNEFLNELGDDRPEWRQLFLTLDMLEEQELVTIDRFNGNGKIDTMQLTSLGAERAREAQQEANR